MTCIHFKSSSRTIGIVHVELIQGHCLIRMPLPDPNRYPFHLNSQRQRKLSKMKKQKNHSQLKEQEKIPEKKKQIKNLPDKEFKTLVIKILTELGKIVDVNT